jgi:hypothetical protein
MGLRGPAPKPENKRPEYHVFQEDIAPPPGTPAKTRKLFERLVAENRAANVSIRQVDAQLYADLADLMLRRDSTDDDQLFLAYGRQISNIRALLCIGPRNRVRAGVPAKVEKKTESPALRILALAKQQG